MPCVPWHVDVDAHYVHWSQAIGQAWQDAAEPSPRQPRQSYLTQESLCVVDFRKMLRRFLVGERQCLDRLRQTVAFAVLFLHARGSVLSQRAVRVIEAQQHAIRRSIALAGAQLQRTTMVVRRAVRRDRIAHLQSLSDAVSLCDLRDPRRLYAALRRAFPSTRPSRRSGAVPLPFLIGADGSVVSSPAGRAESWRLHFSNQEVGQAVTPAEYSDIFAAQTTYSQQHTPQFCIHTVPHLTEVEDIVLSLAPRKAAGVDGITAELLRLSTVDTARQLFPVFTKTALGCREPTAWRGGQLMCLAKKAAGAYTCEAFRSILLASIPGKAYHRVLRTRLLPALCAASSALQAGSKPGVGTDGISAAARAYQELQLSMGRLPAIVYFDLKAAYYRMLRQLVVPMGKPQERFMRLLHSLQLPPQALEELKAHLVNLSSLELANVTPHTIALISDLFRGTWFRMERDEVLTLTARGSRPGDPLADVLFAFSLSAYIRSCEDALLRSGLATALPPLRHSPLTTQLPCKVNLGFAAWADDMARLLAADTWTRLECAVAQTMQICVEHAASCGMSFAFAKHKTAVLLPAMTGRGRGRKVVAGTRPDSFQIHNRVTGEFHHLEVVSVYRHLGSIVAADGSPALEIAHRKSLATGITRAHTARLFANTAFPLKVSRTLLRSLSVSKFVYGAAGLNLCSAVHRSGWCNAYTDLWRRLTKIDWSSVKRVHSYAVLHVAQAPSPLLALAATRSTFLRRLVLDGAVECLHLFQAQWEHQPLHSWFGQVVQDIQLVAQYVESAGLLLQQRSPLHALLESIHTDDGWWVRTVKRACRLCVADFGSWQRARQAPRTVSANNAAQTDSQTPGPLPQAAAGTCDVHDADNAGQNAPGVRHPLPFGCHLCRSTLPFANCFVLILPKPMAVSALLDTSLPRSGYFHCPLRVQQHLKQSARCMSRLPHLIAPLSV